MKRQDYEARILRVLAHIEANLAEDMSLDTLADVAALSRFHFHRVFRGLAGETVSQRVRRLRLHRAAARLLAEEAPVAEIASAVGYDNLSSFTRAFTAAYGQPPAEFRQSGRLIQQNPPNSGDLPMFPVTIKTQPALRLAALAHRGDYQLSSQAFERVGAIFATRGLWAQARGMVGVYYDDPAATPVDELRCHAGIIVDEGFEIPEDLEELRLRGGRYAVMAHKGPYATLHKAYDALFQEWLPSSGVVPADLPVYENYLNDPSNTPAPELRTDICLPLKDE